MEPWMIYTIVSACVVILLVVLLFVVLKVRKNIRIKESNRKADEKIEESASHLSLLFGGKENIKGISSKGSRVSVEVLDPSKLEKDAICNHKRT